MDEGLKRFWWGSPQKNHKKYCVRKFFQKEGFMSFFLEDSHQNLFSPSSIVYLIYFLNTTEGPEHL